MSDLIQELNALIQHLENGDVVAAGLRLSQLTEEERTSLLSMALRRPTARRRLQKLAGQQGVHGSIAKAVKNTRSALSEQLSSWPELLKSTGAPLREQVHTMKSIAERLKALTVDFERSEKWTAEDVQSLTEQLNQMPALPSEEQVSEAFIQEFDRIFSGEDGFSLCVRALVRSWTQENLTGDARDLWQRAFEQLKNEGDSELLTRTVRVLQIDAVKRGDLDAVAELSAALGTTASDPRQRVVACLEQALVSARSSDFAKARANLELALELSANNADLTSHVLYVDGEVEWMAGRRKEALSKWGAILREHKSVSTPSGTCRAALGIAKVARSSGNKAEEQAAYRLATQTALQLGDPFLVEQSVLGLARARAEAGDQDVEAALLPLLKDDERYHRLREALRGGVVQQMVNAT